MKRNANRFGLSAVALILAVLLVGTAVLAPCLVSAEDGEGGGPIQDTSRIRTEGPGEREPLAPSFASPGGGDILFEQLPTPPEDPDWNSLTSSTYLGYLCMEDFWGITEDITDIHWYGLSLYCCWSDCDPTGMEFQIIFYEDSGGYPGMPVGTFSNVVPTITYYDTYPYYPAPLTVYRFDVANLWAPVGLTEGWVSIQSTYSPSGCNFLWLISPYGNSNAIQNGYPIGYNLAFALTGMPPPPPPPPNVKYLHAEGGWMNITDPTGTQWHELWPIFCREYHMSSWNDTSGDGVLSRCDRIDMYEKPDGELRPYHVEDVTITLNVTHNVTGESMFIELEGGYNASVLIAPNCTYWHEIYPGFCREYQLKDWIDSGNPMGELSFCDYIVLGAKGACIPGVMCPLDEDFSGAFPPSGWTTDFWEQSNTNSAGGTLPEAWLPFWNTYTYPSSAYLESKPVDTTDKSSLTLEFKSFIDDYSGGYYCRVYTRAHGGDGWTDVTPWSNPISGNVGPGTYFIDISSDIGSGTQVLFDFSGYYYDTYFWYVDDVKICGARNWWHVEEVAVDIVITPEPPPVGGEAYPVSKASLIAPWIGVGLLLASGISWYLLRRRKAQS